MNVHDKFRKRWLGQMGYAGGAPEMVGQPILHNKNDQAENNQTQQKSIRHKGYKLGTATPRRMRTLNG